MNYINFDETASYFQQIIVDTTEKLQEDGLITPNDDKHRPFKYSFFVNKGDYHNAIKRANNADNQTYPEIPILIKNMGGIQDPNSPLKIYLQKVEIEIYGWCERKDIYKDQWTDMETILSTVASKLKGITTSISNSTVKVEVSDYPTLNELDNKHFLGFLNANLVIIFGGYLSNKDTLRINGREIPYTNLTEVLTTEMLSDNKKTTMVKFLPNVSTYQIALTGLYDTTNDVVSLMVDGCSKGTLYAQPFTVELIRNGKVLANRTMYIKEFKTLRSFGSIVAYDASFWPSYIGG